MLPISSTIPITQVFTSFAFNWQFFFRNFRNLISIVYDATFGIIVLLNFENEAITREHTLCYLQAYTQYLKEVFRFTAISSEEMLAEIEVHFPVPEAIDLSLDPETQSNTNTNTNTSEKRKHAIINEEEGRIDTDTP